MPLSLKSNFPSGNARFESQSVDGLVTELHFSAEPKGGALPLWWNFTLSELKPESPGPEGRKVKIVWRFADSCYGVHDALAIRPVIRAGEQDWARMRNGRPELQPDGQLWISWDIDYPSPSIEMALCFPYGKEDLKQLHAKTKNYWQEDAIGIGSDGRHVLRWANQHGSPSATLPGIYFIGRPMSGDVPSSWVLDGFLAEFARLKKTNVLIWGLPFLSGEGLHKGYSGRGAPFPTDANLLCVARDKERWQTRCTPALVILFEAAHGSASDGLAASFCKDGQAAAESEKLANLLASGLGRDVAASDFKRTLSEEMRSLLSVLGALYLPHLSISTPWSLIGDNTLSRKSYREFGHKIASILAQRFK